jgi:hypothetical protein
MSGFLSRRFGVIAAAAALLAVAVGGTAYALSASSSAHIASLTMAGRSQAALKITGGTPVLDVSVANLHGALLRASTPDGAPIRPVLSGSAPIVLSLASGGTTSARARTTRSPWCSARLSCGAWISPPGPSGPTLTCAAAGWAGSP